MVSNCANHQFHHAILGSQIRHVNTSIILCNFLKTLSLFSQWHFHLLLSLPCLGAMVTYCTYLIISSNKSKNIHSTISWDVNSMKFSDKLTQTYSFPPLFFTGETRDWSYRCRHERVSGSRPKVLFDSWDIFFHEQLGWELNCSRWETFKDGGLTVFQCSIVTRS